MTSNLEQEFRVIEAHHAVSQRQTALIKLLLLLLRVERSEWVGLNEMWEARQVVERYPEYEYLIGTAFENRNEKYRAKHGLTQQ